MISPSTCPSCRDAERLREERTRTRAGVVEFTVKRSEAEDGFLKKAYTGAILRRDNRELDNLAAWAIPQTRRPPCRNIRH
jgi:hypothetical protein